MKTNVLKSTNRPIPERTFWGFDTEDDSKGNVKQICVSGPDGFYRFRDRERARRFFYTLPKGSTVVATNLEYDLLNVFGDALALLDFRFKASGSVIVSARLQGTTVRFYDTLNHSPMGVAGLGEYLGLPKLKMDLSSWEYVERDTLISQRFAEELQRSYNALGCGFYATLPASAMDLYRRNFLPFPITQPERRRLDFMYEGYYGGRTEVFRVDPRRSRIFYIDVNSMYPAVMRGEYPNPNISRWSRRMPDSGFAVVEALVNVPRSIYFPPLPLKRERLIFPTGMFRGVWSSEELRYAESVGCDIVRVYRALCFPTLCEPFRPYVDFLYPKKKHAASDLDRYTAKILLNSLYGKFGERVEVVNLIPLAKVRPHEAAVVYGDLAIVKRGEEIPPHTNVAWSLHTTAQARILLTRSLADLRERGATVLYCDTDSIVYEAPHALHDEGSELGTWRLEGTFDFAHFLAPKLYALEGDGKRTVRAKGVPRDFAPVFFDEERATFSRPYRFRTVLRKGLKGTYWAEFTKTRKTPYTKRKIVHSGETEPLYIVD